MPSLRAFAGASALAGATILSGCAALENHVVLGTMEIGGKSLRPLEPHYYALDACLKDGQRIFDQYAREDYKRAAAANPKKPVDVAWTCRDWVVTSAKGFEFQRSETFVPVTP